MTVCAWCWTRRRLRVGPLGLLMKTVYATLNLQVVDLLMVVDCVGDGLESNGLV